MVKKNRECLLFPQTRFLKDPLGNFLFPPPLQSPLTLLLVSSPPQIPHQIFNPSTLSNGYPKSRISSVTTVRASWKVHLLLRWRTLLLSGPIPCYSGNSSTRSVSKTNEPDSSTWSSSFRSSTFLVETRIQL